MTPEELLLKAADEMAARGLSEGKYRDDTGAVCAYGAMTLAATGGEVWDYAFAANFSPDARALVERAAELLARGINRDRGTTFDPFTAVTRFNDDPATTSEDVILAMKRAAKG